LTSSVRISRRLRPLRLAFLVDPRDRKAVLRIIEANTCVWGGRFNAIVPHTGSGIRDASSRWTRDEVVAGYLHRFEPDFLVDLSGDGKRFFDPDRVLAEKSVLDREKHGHVEVGISIAAVCRHVYKKDYRFVRREQRRFTMPAVSKELRAYETFLAAAFGRYPEHPEYFCQNFREAFDAVEDAVTSSTLFALTDTATPLKLTGAGIDSQGYRGPAVFLLDAKRPSDVIDYWNLRALGWELLPFPIQWSDALLGGATTFLHERLSYYGNHSYMRVPKIVLGARSIVARQIREYTALFGADAPLPLTSQEWYPPIWNRWAQSHDVERCELTAGSDDVDCTVEGTSEAPFVSMSPFSPPFELSFPMNPDIQWANVVSVSSNTPVPRVPPVVPAPLDVEAAFGGVFRNGLAAMGEGIVLYGGRGSRQFLSLPSPAATSRAWFKAQGYSAETSPAGRIALTMIRALRGLLTVHAKSMAHRDLIQYLDRLSHGLIESNHHTGFSTARARSADWQRAARRHAGGGQNARGLHRNRRSLGVARSLRRRCGQSRQGLSISRARTPARAGEPQPESAQHPERGRGPPCRRRRRIPCQDPALVVERTGGRVLDVRIRRDHPGQKEQGDKGALEARERGGSAGPAPHPLGRPPKGHDRRAALR
jgi:hypothetical protein